VSRRVLPTLDLLEERFVGVGRQRPYSFTGPLEGSRRCIDGAGEQNLDAISVDPDDVNSRALKSLCLCELVREKPEGEIQAAGGANPCGRTE
jgi:hypothetical protein